MKAKKIVFYLSFMLIPFNLFIRNSRIRKRKKIVPVNYAVSVVFSL